MHLHQTSNASTRCSLRVTAFQAAHATSMTQEVMQVHSPACECSDLFEGAAELRMLLCREQTANGKRTVHVVTACGIFVQHILDAAPIDKYFEMFKPGSGSEGGFVRLKMRLLSGPDARKTKGAASSTGQVYMA